MMFIQYSVFSFGLNIFPGVPCRLLQVKNALCNVFSILGVCILGVCILGVCILGVCIERLLSHHSIIQMMTPPPLPGHAPRFI